MSATQQPRPNPMKGRVVARGETTASAGNVANIITVVRILLAPVFVWMLIADDGEWTRRKIGSLEAAFRFGNRCGIPVYEVFRTGYPQRKRDYDERSRRPKTLG